MLSHCKVPDRESDSWLLGEVEYYALLFTYSIVLFCPLPFSTFCYFALFVSICFTVQVKSLYVYFTYDKSFWERKFVYREVRNLWLIRQWSEYLDLAKQDIRAMSSKNDRNEFRGFSKKTKILKRGREKNREHWQNRG